MKKGIIISCLFCLFNLSFSQEKVAFLASDGLEIIADKYYSGRKAYRYIILLHQDGSSRGEYLKVAPKLKNLEYNCLAVDLRSGDEINYVNNETAKNAVKGSFSTTYLDTKKDILAAIDYAHGLNNKRVILLGSSYSASLCLWIANSNPKVQAVIALSPGEFLRPDVVIKNELQNFNKPVFIQANQRDYKYVKNMVEGIPEDKKHFYTTGSNAPHGAKILWDDYQGSKDVWLSLMMFFNEVKKDIFD